MSTKQEYPRKGKGDALFGASHTQSRHTHRLLSNKLTMNSLELKCDFSKSVVCFYQQFVCWWIWSRFDKPELGWLFLVNTAMVFTTLPFPFVVDHRSWSHWFHRLHNWLQEFDSNLLRFWVYPYFFMMELWDMFQKFMNVTKSVNHLWQKQHLFAESFVQKTTTTATTDQNSFLCCHI